MLTPPVGRSASPIEHDSTDRPASRWAGFPLRQHAAALAIFAVVTVAFFFPLLQGDTFLNIDRRQGETHPWAYLQTGTDDPTIHYDVPDWAYPNQVFTARAVRNGELPLWDPHSLGGRPFIANGSSGVLYPPRLGLSLVLSSARVHDALLVSHFFFAGVAMFLLLGVVGRSFPAALVGSIAWMVNSFAASWQFLEHYIAIEVWFPVGVLLVHIAVRRRSWPATFALALSLGLLFHAGNVLFVELAVVAIFGYGVTLSAVEAWRNAWSLPANAARLGIAGALGAGLTAATSISTLGLAADAARRTPTYAELAEFALRLTELSQLVLPPDLWTEPYHQNIFAGSAVAALAIVGLAGRHVLAAFSAAMAVVTILFMLHTPITFAVTHVLPGLDGFKPLPRAAFLLQLALAVLAAFGFDTVLRVVGARASRLKPGWAVSSALTAFILLTVLAQAYRVNDIVMTHQSTDEKLLFPSTPLIRHLQGLREARFLPTMGAFVGATAMVHELGSAGGYDNLPPERTQNFWRVLGNGLAPAELASNTLIYAFFPLYEFSKLRPDLLAKAGVPYVVTPPGTADPRSLPAGFEPSYDGEDGSVFAVPDALPRAYVVGACERVPTELSALERFIADEFRPRRAVILEGAYFEPGRPGCAGGLPGPAGTARVVDRSLSTLEVAVNAVRAGWLVVNETWDRDWRAIVDDRPADVLPANYVHRAVRVPQGSHHVSFSYEPAAFRLGALVSVSSLGVALGGLALALIRRRW